MSALENSVVLQPSGCEAASKSSSTDLRHRFTSSVGRLLREIAKWRQQRLALAELGQFDDRMLKDIGISRAEIRDVVYNGR